VGVGGCVGVGQVGATIGDIQYLALVLAAQGSNYGAFVGGCCVRLFLPY
jgi:hypothetical protein